MLDSVTTNGASIFVLILLWSSLTWAVTYLYMNRKVRDFENKIDVLDWYCYESDKTVALWRDAYYEKDNTYVDYVLTDKGQRAIKESS
jgi:hypothetical protein